MRFIHDQLSTKVLNFSSSLPTQTTTNIMFSKIKQDSTDQKTISSLMTSMQQIDLNPKCFLMKITFGISLQRNCLPVIYLQDCSNQKFCSALLGVYMHWVHVLIVHIQYKYIYKREVHLSGFLKGGLRQREIKSPSVACTERTWLKENANLQNQF